MEGESDNLPTQYIDRKKLLSSGSSPEIEYCREDENKRSRVKSIDLQKAKTINKYKDLNKNQLNEELSRRDLSARIEDNVSDFKVNDLKGEDTSNNSELLNTNQIKSQNTKQ